jgi:hypothetical protein
MVVYLPKILKVYLLKIINYVVMETENTGMIKATMSVECDGSV